MSMQELGFVSQNMATGYVHELNINFTVIFPEQTAKVILFTYKEKKPFCTFVFSPLNPFLFTSPKIFFNETSELYKALQNDSCLRSVSAELGIVYFKSFVISRQLLTSIFYRRNSLCLVWMWLLLGTRCVLCSRFTYLLPRTIYPVVTPLSQ